MPEKMTFGKYISEFLKEYVLSYRVVRDGNKFKSFLQLCLCLNLQISIVYFFNIYKYCILYNNKEVISVIM